MDNRFRQLRRWFPVPDSRGRPELIRWLLLEGDRLAVAAGLLLLVFASIVVTGFIWTFEMQRLLTETDTVQTILNTFMSGIILLVSIVVSINSIALSYDITSIQTQEERIEGAMDFRRKVGNRTAAEARPSDQANFLESMSNVILEHVDTIEDTVEGEEGAFVEETREFVDNVRDDLTEFRGIGSDGADFGVLWLSLAFEYGEYVDSARKLRDKHGAEMSTAFEERLDNLVHEFELFAVGREYFKTLFYNREVSDLSRTLLVVSLPAIIATASTILLIDAGILPDVVLFGLPPLQTFVAMMITISLAPYVVLTSFMLRITTVAIRTSDRGPFWLR